ncbi:MULTISPECIES: glutathione peroxidase [Candidatus Ichthyocystis]|nr:MULTISPECIES: glutathione peroxidase [Ichthyocystis]
MFIHSAYDFGFQVLTGGEKVTFFLSDLAGKVIIIVNTASQCALSNQYKDMVEVHDLYHNRGLVMVNVPSNSFFRQEPRSDEEISISCVKESSDSFITVVREVVVGDHAHPFYRWAGDVLGFAASPWWNFHKYIINRRGGLVDYFCPLTHLNSARVIEVIERLLVEES